MTPHAAPKGAACALAEPSHSPVESNTPSLGEGDPGLPARVVATEAAEALIAEIRLDHPEILFHQSGGCCDGSSPMCYPADDFRVGGSDVLLGEVAGAAFYIHGSQYEVWKHTQVILDVVPGRGGMFSLDNGRERRFLVRARVFTPVECERLGIEPPAAGAGAGCALDTE